MFSNFDRHRIAFCLNSLLHCIQGLNYSWIHVMLLQNLLKTNYITCLLETVSCCVYAHDDLKCWADHQVLGQLHQNLFQLPEALIQTYKSKVTKMLICLHMPWVLSYPALVIGLTIFVQRFKTQSSKQLQHSSFYPLFRLHRQLKETRRGGSGRTCMHYSEDKAYHSW